MNDKDIGVDETTPIIHPMEIEAALDALVVNLVEIRLEVSTISTDRIQEEHTGIEAQDGCIGASVCVSGSSGNFPEQGCESLSDWE